MVMASLPARLPHTVDELVDELDALNPAPVVDSMLINEQSIQELVFKAGRRSVIEELLRIKTRTRKESLNGSRSR